MPPPIPVPSVTPISRSAPRPAPIHHSPKAKQLASLSRTTGNPIRLAIMSTRGTSRHPRLGVWSTTPLLRSRGPGAPIPPPATFALPTSAIAVRSIDATSSTTATGPRAARVGALDTATGDPPAKGTSPTRRLVPPMSTPAIHRVRARRSGIDGAAVPQRAARRGRRHRTHDSVPSSSSTAMNASCGISTEPTCFILLFPSFWRSRSLRLRVMSPP